jgi:hypothetical protein
VRRAVGEERYQPPLTKDAAQMRSRETELLLLAVGAEPPITASLKLQSAEITAGQKIEVPIVVYRKAGYKEKVAITALGLPPGLTAAALSLDPNATEGKLVITAAKGAAEGPALLVVQAASKDATVAAPAIPLAVRKPG